ncbi:MAG: MTH1187 family thiamine-binding protein [Gammaproteobacteria bacterium]|nr:MTH1187 family thiamine-binding protein [Gammaproteobacteria bacterium]MBU1653613.1 MTH1187 family thiamine-binding protein [Gammaproteobacteria bacterium]MBU1960978.1 MTH1187 family thiamine-binding protein [Gammaproteobacteria bacterium]
MSVLMEFSMFPTDKGESVSPYVSEVIRMIRESGVSYRLTPMGTIIETEQLAEALAIIEQAEQVLSRQECRRIYSSIKLDIRAGKSGRMEGKIKSVTEKIGEVKG